MPRQFDEKFERAMLPRSPVTDGVLAILEAIRPFLLAAAEADRQGRG